MTSRQQMCVDYIRRSVGEASVLVYYIIIMSSTLHHSDVMVSEPGEWGSGQLSVHSSAGVGAGARESHCCPHRQRLHEERRECKGQGESGGSGTATEW